MMNAQDSAKVLCLLDKKALQIQSPLISLWYPNMGEADMRLEDGTALHLSADTMVLTKSLAACQAGEGISCLHFGLKGDNAGKLSLSELCRMSPMLEEMIHSHQSVFILSDRYALVAGAVQCLLLQSKLPACASEPFESMLCGYTLLCAADASDAPLGEKLAGNRHVRRALSFMQTHYAQDIQARDIAEAVGIHTGHLHRLFSEQSGKSVNEYLQSLRVEKAKLILMGSRLPMESIALSCGFSSRPYFHRVFKKVSGLSPQQFRNAFNITCDYTQAKRFYETSTWPDEEGAP